MWGRSRAALEPPEILGAYVFRNHDLIAPNRRHEVPARPEVLAGKVSVLAHEIARNVDRALPLDEANARPGNARSAVQM